MPQLLIRLNTNPKLNRYFWLSNQNLEELSPSQAASLSLQTPAVVFVPASCVRLDRLSLPPGVKAAEASILLEEELCQDLEEVTSQVLVQTGQEILVATYNSLAAASWREFLALEQIQVARWLPEALCWQEFYPATNVSLEVSNLVAEESSSQFFWQASSLTLIEVKTDLAAGINKQFNAASNQEENAEFAVLDLATHKNFLQFLASAAPEKTNLWPTSWWQQLGTKLLPAQFIAKLNLSAFLAYKRQALPWALLLFILITAQIFTWLQPSNKPNLPEATQVEARLQELNQRFDALSQHLNWQQARLDAWLELRQVLASLPHLEVSSLQLDATGLEAHLSNLQPEDNQQLEQLAGTWQFEDQTASWKLKMK